MTDIDDQLHPVPLQDHTPAPSRYQVAVLMQCVPVNDNPWISARWEVLSVIPARLAVIADASEPFTYCDGHRIVRHDGLDLRLHPDESESYYHNLMVDDPRCFVVCRQDEAAGVPIPTLVTVSFDEANAYAEGDDRVESVALPFSLQQALESYVLTHYVPTRKIKRKRQKWTEPR